MKIGFQLPYFDWPGAPVTTASKLKEIVEAVEEAGFSSFWVMDHLFQIGGAFGAKDAPLPEAYTTLSYVAGLTKSIKLGVLVTNNVLRYPGVLVKMVTTLDVLSGGRMYLGIGPGGMVEREIVGYGVHRPPLRERISRLEETLKIAHHMWSDDRTTFKGRYYTLEEPICSPQPISRPHPYIMIGGGGEEKTLRYVARYGDACNLHLGAHPKLKGNERSYMNYRTRRERLTHKLDVLRMHCEREGRDYDEIDKSVLSPMEVSPGALTPGEAVGMCRELSEMGFNYVVFNMPNDHEITPIEVIGEEVIPEIMDL